MSGGAITNKRVNLARRPHGLPRREDWAFVAEPVRPPGPGEVVVAVTHISCDPAMRGWMDARRSYAVPVELGAVMRATAAGEVIESRDEELPVGARVTGMLGVQTHATVAGSALHRIDPALAPVPRYLGALGSSGLTAYFGIHDIGRPRHGETVVVSGAAGAVGSVAAQIAKLHGCRTIGIAGGAEKCGWLTDELGLDAAIDYKSEDLAARLAALTPDRVDVYFDNVGGEILDAVLPRLALRARVVFCGAISQYNATSSWAGPRNYRELLYNRASVTGMIVGDLVDRWPEGRKKLAEWVGEGAIKAREQVVAGEIEDFPATMLRLFRGENVGKLVLALER